MGETRRGGGGGGGGGSAGAGAWVVLLGGAMLFNALDLPGWIGFMLGLVALTAVARLLAVRALRWRMAQWLNEHAVLRGAQPGTPD